MMIESRLKMEIDYLLGALPLLTSNFLLQRNSMLLQQQQQQYQSQVPPLLLQPLLQSLPQMKQSSPQDKENNGFRLYTKAKGDDIPELQNSSTSQHEEDIEDSFIPKLDKINPMSKKISKSYKQTEETKSSKKVYEISRFFVKNYIGALKATINNPNCEADIMEYLSCTKETLAKIRLELEKLLKENPKHNRMQLYKLMVNPSLNSVFQYFLRRKVYAWIFTSSKMQDKHAHLMARKNFLFLCLNAHALTPNNFKIALNSK